LLLAAHEIWPEAPIYTSAVSKKWETLCGKKNINLHTSFMQKFPLKERLNRFYSILGLHMLAFETFDFSDYDLVISISSRYAHGIITKPTTKHICYMNSPGRMFLGYCGIFFPRSLVYSVAQGFNHSFFEPRTYMGFFCGSKSGLFYC